MTIPTTERIRVMLVDDHTMVRRGLATFLKVFDDMQMVGEAESGEAAIQLCAKASPDVILMDMRMPDYDGGYGTRKIKDTLPDIKVLVLTTFDDKETVDKAIERVSMAPIGLTRGSCHD